MKREELETKIAELQEQLKELDEQVEYRELKAGDHFEWCGLTFVKLKNNLALLNDLKNVKGEYCMFDPYDNNYNESMIREYINTKFLNINNIDTSELNYVYENTDYATLLSKEEYEENRDIITLLDYLWWLRSPGFYTILAYYIDSDNIIHSGYVNYSNSVIRVTFNLKSDTKVSIVRR